eukprot:SM000045S16245  [mRNA]  locus=s45:388079:392447:- [translate_table: standard]
MAGVAHAGDGDRGYEAALRALSTLITRRKRADGSNWGDAFSLMLDYVRMLELDESLARLSIIHVAGTKGKGSTCAFAESILRACGLRTGMFTSPHLIDIRERFRFDGVEVGKEVFLSHFWWCWDKLQKSTLVESVPMPAYFRFLTLLAFRIFAEEKVDVLLLEVGIGGRFDATNVIQRPAVCGITSLGFDHTELLGDTLPAIAREKAGIFKVELLHPSCSSHEENVPAITSPQPADALATLRQRADELGVELQVAPLLTDILEQISLGLAGEHQRVNASLAVALCRAWAARTERQDHVAAFDEAIRARHLPESYKKGLTTAHWPGRAQVVDDTNGRGIPGFTFFLDGAHTPESMEVCAKWFCQETKKEQDRWEKEYKDNHSSTTAVDYDQQSTFSTCERILLFNCMPERDPAKLLPPLLQTVRNHGTRLDRALFVPTFSSYSAVGSFTSPVSSSSSSSPPDLTWQLSLQQVWESAICNTTKSPGSQDVQPVKQMPLDFLSCTSPLSNSSSTSPQLHTLPACSSFVGCTSAVIPSLPAALDYLRSCSRLRRPNTRLQVLVTGSLHLVGDLLRLLH